MDFDLGPTGILKLDGAFDRDAAACMRDVVWAELARRHGIERDDPATWDRHAPTGLKTSKRSRAFAPICSDTVGAALDEIFGASRWRRPEQFGNVLVTMPNASAWRVPDRIWHSDFPPTLDRGRVPVVKLWALLDEVDPGGGGTPQLAGSHRAFADYVAETGETDYKRAKFGFLKSHPWLRELSNDNGESDRNVRMASGADIGGTHCSIVECTGRAGDVYVTHPWVFHSIAVNATARPRMMRSCAVWAESSGSTLHLVAGESE